MGVQSLRTLYIDQGFSPQVVELMLSAKRDSTHKQYNTYISAWLDYCKKHQVSPSAPTIPQALDFLECLRVDRNLGYNAMNTARSALSSLLPHLDGIPFGQNSHVKLYMRGTFNTSPPKPRYHSTWDPDVVLKLLKDWSPVDTLDLKKLTLKLLMLILLVSGQRISTILLLSIDCLQISDSYATFHVFDMLKQSRPGYTNPVVKLRVYDRDVDLCVVSILQTYLSRTSSIRKDTKSLFVTLRPPHTGAAKDTLTRWVRTVMSTAGIDTNVFRPHSVRAASTSAAKRGGATVAEILGNAGWTTTSTFTRFYNKPVLDTSRYDVAILGNKI